MDKIYFEDYSFKDVTLYAKKAFCHVQQLDEFQKLVLLKTRDYCEVLNLNLLKEKYPKVIKQIRGRGYLIGIQLYKDQSNFIKKLMDQKLLTIRAADNVVRILPPLNVKKRELDQAIKIIDKVCAKL